MFLFSQVTLQVLSFQPGSQNETIKRTQTWHQLKESGPQTHEQEINNILLYAPVILSVCYTAD